MLLNIVMLLITINPYLNTNACVCDPVLPKWLKGLVMYSAVLNIYSSLPYSSSQTRTNNTKIIYQSRNPSTDNYWVKQVHMKIMGLQKEVKSGVPEVVGPKYFLPY